MSGPLAFDSLEVVLGAGPLYLAFCYLVGAYRPTKGVTGKDVIWRPLVGAALTFSALLLAAALTKTTGSFSRAWFISWALASLGGIVLYRGFRFALLENQLARGACLSRALLICLGGSTQLNPARIALKTRNRTRAIAHVHLAQVDDLDALAGLVAKHHPDSVIIEAPWADFPVASQRAAQALQDFAVELSVVPIQDGLAKVLRVERLGSRLALQLAEQPISRWSGALKRTEDILIAGAALFLLAPILLLVAAAIRVESRGPVLFRQVRKGLNGQHIQVWKFRSMYASATDQHAAKQTSRDDPRVTGVGRILRKTSLDELPQLFNVLQGTMSIVGPRPHALRTTAGGLALEEAAARYAARHRVKPGITGWAQVNGYRGELDTVEKLRGRVEYDIDYIENWSLLLDLKIILMTALKVVHDPKAY